MWSWCMCPDHAPAACSWGWWDNGTVNYLFMVLVFLWPPPLCSAELPQGRSSGASWLQPWGPLCQMETAALQWKPNGLPGVVERCSLCNPARDSWAGAGLGFTYSCTGAAVERTGLGHLSGFFWSWFMIQYSAIKYSQCVSIPFFLVYASVLYLWNVQFCSMYRCSVRRQIFSICLSVVVPDVLACFFPGNWKMLLSIRYSD